MLTSQCRCCAVLPHVLNCRLRPIENTPSLSGRSDHVAAAPGCAHANGIEFEVPVQAGVDVDEPPAYSLSSTLPSSLIRRGNGIGPKSV
jgi:hypothetical protein